MIKRFLYYIAFILTLTHLAGCSTAPKTVILPSLPSPRMDTIHAVGPGETLWRIGKMYDVSVDDLIKANQLSNPKDLKMGQKLHVPNAAQIKPIITLYPSDKWKYIIIHHSGTE